MSSKIKTGDEVIVLTGKYKGKTGKVLKFVKQANRAIVEGINMVKKHVKPDPRAQKPGGIEEREAPIHVSNLAIYNPVSKKADRVGFKFLDDGKKVRIFRSDNESIDV